jgi:LAO/AO transport system kinase
MRIGISGPPGEGKSRFIEALGVHLLQNGHKLAVLAVDPSSRLTGGSILGDKTRMMELSRHKDAFIRPSPSGGELGGVARNTREAMYLCEAAGYDVIFVETVGVGQSEIAVYDMVDCFLLLLQPGSGDELQGIKRGILEMADLLVVNKADGAQLEMAQKARQDYSRAIHLLTPKSDNWTPKVMLGSAYNKELITKIWRTIKEYFHFLASSGALQEKRQEQNLRWFDQLLDRALRDLIQNMPQLKESFHSFQQEIVSGLRSAPSAVDEFMKLILER